MKYDLYFHNDFDGKAAAAIVLAFLESRGDRVEYYVPMDHAADHGRGAGYFNENFFKGKNPGIVLDYRYHPGAAWWFDHHPTAFRTEAWRKRFRSDERHRLDPSYISACHLVYDSLRRDFGWKPLSHLKELAKWLDVVDGARYASAEQVIRFREPALQVALYADRGTEREREARWFIGLLAHRPLAAIAAEPKIKKFVAAFRTRLVAGLAFSKKNIVVDGRVGTLDISGRNLRSIKEGLRFAPFYFYPTLESSIRITEKDGRFNLGWGVNPWRKNNNRLDIGKILKEYYGGGGHRNAGGAGFKTHADAMNAIAELVVMANQNNSVEKR